MDLSKTNLNGGILNCAPMETLEVVYLKTEWNIEDITYNRNTVHTQTKIVVVD